MNYRKLRIAWSVGWGVICLLLIVLWVRSYWWFDTLELHTTTLRTSYFIATEPGRLDILFAEKFDNLSDWELNHERVVEVIEPFATLRFTFVPGALHGVIVPFWFPLLVSVALSVLPWVRFSLRTLLIATTLVAVVLGLLVMMLRGS